MHKRADRDLQSGAASIVNESGNIALEHADCRDIDIIMFGLRGSAEQIHARTDFHQHI